MAESRLFPSPNDWLAGALKERKFSQRSLARALGVDVSRFNRWVHGEEQIPRACLLELGQHLPPTDLAYLLRLKDCEDCVDQLTRRTQALADAAGLGSYPLRALFRQVESLLAQEHPLDSCVRVDVLLRHLVDAVGAATIVQRGVGVSFQEPLLFPPTVARFRYPINHFIGTLLDLDEFVPAKAPEAARVQDFRVRLLDSLRPLAAAKPIKNRWNELARQFSVHMLARHGSEDDRARVKELLRSVAASADPLLRRISFTGVILGGSEAELTDRFLSSLKADTVLDRVNLFFNAFHYGDATFASDGSFPQRLGSFHGTVGHVLRHLEQPSRYASIQSVEAWTLLQILETAGTKPFLQRSVLSRLQSLLRSDSFPSRLTDRGLRQTFQRQFTRLLKDAR